MSTVFAFGIDDLSTADLDRVAAVVPAQRRARASRYHFPDDRARCVVAGALLRYALATHHGLSIRDGDLTVNTFGKPLLANRPDVFFNLSHAGRWAVCAVSTGEIGIDVERIEPTSATIAHRLAPEEYAYVVDASAEERPRRFTRIWTLKESYLKYRGLGLSQRLDAFSVSVGQGRPRLVRGQAGPRPFLKQVPHDDDYYIAECSDDDSEITVVRPPLDVLLLAH